MPWKWAAGLPAMMFCASLGAQDPLKNTLTMGFGDVAAIKQRAEMGDPAGSKKDFDNKYVRAYLFSYE